jgi:hypothetical protein
VSLNQRMMPRVTHATVDLGWYLLLRFYYLLCQTISESSQVRMYRKRTTIKYVFFGPATGDCQRRSNATNLDIV